MGFFDIFKGKQYKAEAEELEEELDELREELEELKAEYKKSGYDMYRDKKKALGDVTNSIGNTKKVLHEVSTNLETAQAELDNVNKQIATQTRKIDKSKELYRSIEHALKVHREGSTPILLSVSETALLEELCPSVTLKVNCLDVKDLRKEFKANEKNIDKLLLSYSERYNTKSNKTIYALMVIALRAEMQNILYNLKFAKLDESIDKVKEITKKYQSLTDEGNQSIAGTLHRFIGEIEHLFLNSVQIEYTYYARKEQARQEQLELRQKMKEEAEERKQLQAQEKKIAKEESKYETELDKVKEMLKVNTDSTKTQELSRKIAELQAQLANVKVKKDEVLKLQNGQAGNVYVISNLGAFGDKMFKIGMTRRLDPLDRINELGNASVPFRFDIHSLIFSDNAVALESKLHDMLDKNRVNKVNKRKEFFHSTTAELEKLVHQIDPTAEFSSTMLAEQYRQSLSGEDFSQLDTTDYEEDDD